MFVSDKYQFLFFHMRKTGGTAIGAAIGEVARMPFDRHYKPRDMKSSEPTKFASYYKWAFVRNPWDRMVSQYCHDTQLSQKHAGRWRSFGDYMRDAEHLRFNGRTTPYVALLGDDMDFVGRFERLEEDFHKICDAVRMPRLPLPRKRATEHDDYREFYKNDLELITVVGEMFKADVEAWEYSYGS